MLLRVRTLRLTRLRGLHLLLIWGCLLLGNRAGAQTWQRAVVASGSYRVVATVADAAGNVYIAGRISGTATFGTTILTSPNPMLGSNPFVAKWSSSAGAFVWAQLVGGSGGGEATALALSGSNVYLAGYYAGTAEFGGPTLNGGGGFVARLTDNGPTASFVWARQAGSERATAVVAQGTSVFVAGSFAGTQTFGTNTLVSAGSTDVFVAKLLDTGAGANFVWGQRGGSAGSDAAYGLAVENTNVYVTGTFYAATASFGATALTNSGVPALYEIFIAKLVDAGSTGSFAWARSAGGAGSDMANAIAVTNGNVYVAGTFQGPTAAFGSFTLAATTSSDLDMFLVKLTDAGASASFGWAQRVGGSGYENATAVASTATGVYLAGYFQSPTISFGTIPLAVIGGGDIFVARLTDTGAAGRFDWAQQAGGGTSYNFTGGLAVVGSAVYVAGSLAPPTTFGTQTITGAPNNLIGFWAQLLDSTQPLAAAPTQAWVGVEVYPNPAHASTRVQLPAGSGATHATLTVRDALGRAVHQQQLPLGAAATVAEVALPGLRPGLYYLQLQAGNLRSTHALTVE